MSLATIRTSLQALVAGVAGISGVAPVYDYLRHVTTDAEVKTILKGANQERLHFWSVTPSLTETLSIVEKPGCDDARYSFDIHGYYALIDSDASEKAFLTIVEAVITAWRADKSLGNTIRRAAPIAWPEHDHRMLAGVLCHHVRLTLAVKKEL